MASRSREIRRHHQESLPTKHLQESVANEIRKVPETFYKQGRLLFVTFSGAGTQEVPHNLGGAAAGALVVDVQTSGTSPVITREGPSSGNEATHVKLVSTAAGNVKVWVWR